VRRKLYYALAAALLLLPIQLWAADGIQPGRGFKVPFIVDGKAVLNRAVVVGDVLTVTYVKGDDLAVLSFKLVPVDDPFPNPDPNPDPNPTPDVNLWGVVVEETSERTPAQAVILTSQPVRELFAGTRFRVLDKDQVVPDSLKPYIARAKVLTADGKKKLPLLFLVAQSGAVLYEDALPADVAATTALVNKHKGVTKR
jgi:hypothetical protein